MVKAVKFQCPLIARQVMNSTEPKKKKKFGKESDLKAGLNFNENAFCYDFLYLFLKTELKL